MLTKIQLTTMLQMQDSINSKINSNWLKSENVWLRAAMMETIEGIDHGCPWKWWKSPKVNLPQLQMEMVDVWHFALSHIAVIFKGDFEHSVETIMKQLGSNKSVFCFDGREYDFEEHNLLENLELMAGLCIARRFNVPLFMKIIEQCDLSAMELYKQYLSKNVLNSFRQDFGYQTGEYEKIWHGREDNEHLVDIVNNTVNLNSLDAKEQVYNQLKKIYSGVLKAG
jgi:dimeric dUTPase (all-alpha-NTP-PPase superfamily)